MELLSNEELNRKGSTQCKPNHVPYCPNCYAMMNELMQLRMELARLDESKTKVKKNFTIAPTLYTFYQNGLAKRNLARYGSKWII